MGIYNTIGIEQIIARAKAQLRLTNTSEYDDYFTMMSYEALGSLNALSQLTKKSCPLHFTDSVAELPKDFVRYLAVRIDVAPDTDADPISAQLNGCQSFLYADTNFLCDCDCDCTGVSQGGFQIQNGYIHLNSEIDVLSAHLAYLGLNVDENGKSVILEKYERALASYCCWKFTMSWNEQFNQYIIDEYKQEWMAQRGKIIGQDAAQSFQNAKREIQDIWKAMLVSKSVNYNI